MLPHPRPGRAVVFVRGPTLTRCDKPTNSAASAVNQQGHRQEASLAPVPDVTLQYPPMQAFVGAAAALWSLPPSSPALPARKQWPPKTTSAQTAATGNAPFLSAPSAGHRKSRATCSAATVATRTPKHRLTKPRGKCNRLQSRPQTSNLALVRSVPLWSCLESSSAVPVGVRSSNFFYPVVALSLSS